MSEVTLYLLDMLQTLESYVSQAPPVPNPKSRFGNPAFRAWYDLMAVNVRDLLKPLTSLNLPKDETETKKTKGEQKNQRMPLPPRAVKELATYLKHSFGDRRRIDYGTGHEAAFVALLLCLRKLRVVVEEDFPAIVVKVFWRYISLMRTLQSTYWLEPAGSHGVWGLDDYHFLPFMFGSAQLRNHRHIRPKSIHDSDVVEGFSKEYMYLACIRFINEVKTASLRWHSPMLDDISGVKTWSKINGGMMKMYKGEVLGKLPIMQHFRFGSLLQFEGEGARAARLAKTSSTTTTPTHSSTSTEEQQEQQKGENEEDYPSSASSEDEDDENHVHVYARGQEFPTCCGLRIPSAFGAAAAAAVEAPNGKVLIGPALEKAKVGGLPFD
ncbi:Serine/threonine-protein phosphatase 2A activator 2 [Quaeritorhiza haematococci]|nr:Serine/threonine-protein phosphatase 2A activator 2 [Quaeritorhiza haematococci]